MDLLDKLFEKDEFGTLKRHSNLLKIKMFKRRFKNDKV